MYSFFVFLFFPSLFFHSVSSFRLPLMDNNIRAPLFVDIDVSNMNQELKGYIDNGIEKEVNDTCYKKIETMVTHRHTELKTKMLDDMSDNKNKYNLEFSSLAKDLKSQFKQLVQNLKNENEVLKKQLEEKSKEISNDLKIKNDIDFSTLDRDIKSKFKQLELNSTKENEAFQTQAEKRYKDSADNLNELIELNKKVISSETDKHFSDIESKFKQLEHRSKRKTEAIKAQVENEITKLNKKVMSGQKRVALTACITSRATRSSGYVWKFDDVRTQTGINNLSSFKSTGKFTCESDGLYLVSAWIMSHTKGSQFYIYKNSNRIVNTYITSNNRNEVYTSTAVVAVELQVHDTVWVTPRTSMSAYNGQKSCLTIVKIK